MSEKLQIKRPRRSRRAGNPDRRAASVLLSRRALEWVIDALEKEVADMQPPEYDALERRSPQDEAELQSDLDEHAEDETFVQKLRERLDVHLTRLGGASRL